MRSVDPIHDRYAAAVAALEAVRELEAENQALTRELERAQRRAAEAEAELEDALSQAGPGPAPSSREARLTADLANLRRHRDEQIAAARRDERVSGLRRLAEVHDDLARSLEAHADPTSPWYQGNEGILRQVRAAIASAGAAPFGVAGERFDPHRHEAVATVTASDASGTIAAVQRAGFALDDGTLVRPALVVVAA